MKRLNLGLAIFFFLFLAGAIPAGASITKIESIEMYVWEDSPFPVTADRNSICDIQTTENITRWFDTANEMQTWKTDFTIAREGICEDGTRIRCTGRLVGNLQDEDLYDIRSLIQSENCWLRYPDGSRAKVMVTYVYAHDEGRVLIPQRWN
jgi:hypothetical protein